MTCMTCCMRAAGRTATTAWWAWTRMGRAVAARMRTLSAGTARCVCVVRLQSWGSCTVVTLRCLGTRQRQCRRCTAAGCRCVAGRCVANTLRAAHAPRALAGASGGATRVARRQQPQGGRAQELEPGPERAACGQAQPHRDLRRPGVELAARARRAGHAPSCCSCGGRRCPGRAGELLIAALSMIMIRDWSRARRARRDGDCRCEGSRCEAAALHRAREPSRRA